MASIRQNITAPHSSAGPVSSSPAPNTRHGRSRRNRGKGRQWKTFELGEYQTLIDEGTSDNYSTAHGSRSERSEPRSPESADFPLLHSEDTADFQVFTGRKNKKIATIPRSQTTLRPARPVVPDLSPYRKQVLEVFGNELPRECFFDANLGTENGQIQFVQLSNGDVLAHQWSSDSYQWVYIGKHCHATSTIEGKLAQKELSLPSTWSQKDMSTLAVFRLLAMQFEAQNMGTEFGEKQVRAALPGYKPPTSPEPATLPAHSTAVQTAVQAMPFVSVPATDLTPTIDLPTSKHPTIHGRQTGHHCGSAPKIVTPLSLPAAYTLSRPTHGEQSSPSPAAARYSITSDNLVPRSVMPHVLHNLQSQYNPWYAAQSMYAHGATASYLQPSAYAPYQHLSYYADNHFSPAAMASMVSSHGRPAISLQHTSPAIGVLSENKSVAQKSNYAMLAPQTRSMMRDAVMRMSEQAKERTKSHHGHKISPHESSTPVDNRYAPGELSATDVAKPLRTTGSGLVATPVLRSSRLNSITSSDFPKTPGHHPLSTFDILQGSSPDRAWLAKPVETLRLINSTYATAPTPQNFNGPFFPADNDHKRACSSLDNKTHRERVDELWWGGNTFVRQEDFYRRVKATSKPPSVGAKQRGYDLGRLLVPVVENLSGYTDTRSQKKHDYWVPWQAAPEWAIDRSASGNDSFFDKDWNPPARIGRDARFRSSPRELRFGRSESIRV